jgi:integrase/recombinase XerD
VHTPTAWKVPTMPTPSPRRLTPSPRQPSALSPKPSPEATRWFAMIDGYLGSLESPRTRQGYASDLVAFSRWCASHRLDPFTLTRQDAEAFRAFLRDSGYAPATIARRLAAVRGLFDYWTDDEVLTSSPFARVRPPKVPNVSPREGLTREEASAMLQAAREPAADALAIGLLLLLGLRASELQTLTADDDSEDRGHRVLTVRGKGGTVTRMPLPPYVAEALDRVKMERPAGGPLLAAPRGGPFDRWVVTALVRRVARAAGITRHVSPHDLRHAFVTHALASGSPLHRVQDAARHADPRTTRRYDRAREALDGHATYGVAAYLLADA